MQIHTKLTGSRETTIIIMDGAVYDISRWLSEHPGGSQIIPLHALGCDATHFFELYHASRQSFLYLQEFYVGELHPEDVEGLKGDSMPTSESFLEVLEAATAWRLRPEDMTKEKDLVSF